MRLQDQVQEQTPTSGGLGSFFGILIAGSIGIIAVTPRGQPVKKSGGGSSAPSGGNGVSAPTSGTGEKYPTATAAKDSKPDQAGKRPGSAASAQSRACMTQRCLAGPASLVNRAAG